jgi:hypothetical protein
MEHALSASRWFNAPPGTTLATLRGEQRRVVVVLAFQMLCPGCVATAIPQVKKVHESLGGQQLAVAGLHTVFEHHEAMTPVALEAFLHEYRVRFPVAVDEPTPGQAIPKTMAAYEMQGTPTLLVFDRDGNLRLHHFGHIEDLALGAMLGQLLAAP